MKTSSLILPVTTLAIILLAACEEESRPRIRNNTAAQSGHNNFGYQQSTPGTATDFVTEATPTPTPAPLTTDTAPEPTPAPAAAPAPERNLQYGTPVPNKPGFVTSPFAPYAGYVDVRGFPPNTEVKDPYSGKIFLVP